MKIWNAWNPLACTAALAFLASPCVRAEHAGPPSSPATRGMRLIQTRPLAEGNHARWMTEEEILELARRSHEQGHCGGFIDITEHPDKQPVYNQRFDVIDGRVPSHQGTVDRLLPELSSERIMGHVRKLSSYPNRFLRSESGAEAARWIHDEFLRLAKGRTDVTAELFAHKFAQPSVIVRIAGKGAHAGERVILGGHEDSINWSSAWPTPKDIAPGADDNASGVATLLETFRVLMDSGFRPDRTVEFIAYAGEEMGLLGSQDIAEKYKRDGIGVVAVLQLDMTLFPGPDGKIQFVSDRTDRPLTRFTETLLDTYVKVPWSEMQCDYACSDHASWTDAGFASVFPFEAPLPVANKKMHTVHDTPERLTPSFGLHFAKLATAFAVELGSER